MMGGGQALSGMAIVWGIVPFLAVAGLLFVLLRLPSWIDAQRERIFAGLARCAHHQLPLLDGLGWLVAETHWPTSGWLDRVATRLEAGEPLDRAMRGAWIGVPFLPSAIPADDRRLLSRAATAVPLEVVLAALAGRYQGRLAFRARMQRHVAGPLYAIFALGTLTVCAAMSSPVFGIHAALEQVLDGVGRAGLAERFTGGLAPLHALATIAGALVGAYYAPRSRVVRRVLGYLPFTRFLVRDLEWIELGRSLAPAIAIGRPLEAALEDVGGTLPLATTRRSVAQWRDALARGVPLREALVGTTAPESWKALVAVGAASGDLARAIEHATDYQEALLAARLGLCEQLSCAGIAVLAGVAVGTFVHHIFALLLAIAEAI